MAECAAGRTVAEVAAHVGVTRATVERWRRQPEFAAAIARYRFGWSRRRLRALALMAPESPGPPLYLREVAAAVGVSRRPLYRWRPRPGLRGGACGSVACLLGDAERPLHVRTDNSDVASAMVRALQQHPAATA